MPRGPRIDYPGAVHHVYARGIEKRDIFLDDRDRDNFLGRVGINLPKWKMRCSAWAIMPNHFHLLLQSDTGLLPTFMHCLLTGYSKYFNDRHKRVGHLFQNRYKSPIVGRVGYFRDAVRYIHLNPLRSGIVPSVDALEEYSWTGHRRILRGGLPEWQDTELLQAEFHDPRASRGWIRNYRQFVEMAEFDSGGHPAPEGTGQLPPTADRASIPEFNGPYEVFRDLLRRIPSLYGTTAEQVLSGERSYLVVRARREIITRCKSVTNIPIVELARWIRMNESAVRYLLNS